MAVVSSKINRGIVSATDGLASSVRARSRDLSASYARDPFKHLEEGHVVVLDLETLRPTLLDPWPHQEALIADWVDLDHLTRTGELRFRNVHEIKSRQVGITWIVAYVCVWALRWHPVRGLALSRKGSEVCDSGPTVDSFFGRVKFIADYRDDVESAEPVGGWPETLRPRLQITGGNDPSIRAPGGGFLAGEGATPDPGRGANYDYVFLDEHAKMPYGRAVQASVSRACPVGRLYNSTVDGEDNDFWQIRKKRPKGYIFRRDHWAEHPVYGRGRHIAASIDEGGAVLTAGQKGCALCDSVKAGLRWSPSEPIAHRYPGKLTSPWYEDAILDLTDDQVASELDIDPTAALTARVYPEFSEERHVAADAIPWLPSVPVELAFDIGPETTAVLICQDTPLEYRVIGEVELHDSIPEQVASAIRAECRKLGMPEAELQKELTRNWLCRADPFGEQPQHGTGRRLTTDYSREGFTIGSSQLLVNFTVRSVKRLLLGRPKEVVISQRCPLFIFHAKHNRWETDRYGNRKPDGRIKNDEHNHMMRAFAYLVAHKFPAPDPGESIARATRHDEGGQLDEGLAYDMALRSVRPRCYESINGDVGRDYVSGLRRVEEVASITPLPGLRETT